MYLVGGLDEVGWGSLAGPIISVVAVFSEKDLLLLPPGVKDSKKCTKIEMANLYLPICQTATDVGIGHAWPEEIDRIGPSAALQLSYKRALDELVHKPTILIVDGNKGISYWKGQQLCKPKADVLFKQVSAASMIGKHFRDSMMKELSKNHPEYNWNSNFGYGSPDHQDAIRKYGLITKPGDYFHRKSYCKNFQL